MGLVGGTGHTGATGPIGLQGLTGARGVVGLAGVVVHVNDTDSFNASFAALTGLHCTLRMRTIDDVVAQTVKHRIRDQ